MKDNWNDERAHEILQELMGAAYTGQSDDEISDDILTVLMERMGQEGYMMTEGEEDDTLGIDVDGDGEPDAVAMDIGTTIEADTPESIVAALKELPPDVQESIRKMWQGDQTEIEKNAALAEQETADFNATQKAERDAGQVARDARKADELTSFGKSNNGNALAKLIGSLKF